MKTKPLPHWWPDSSHYFLQLPVIASAILAFWLLYIGIEFFIYSGRIQPPLRTVVEFIPGLLGLAVLFAGGFNAGDCYLRFAPMSHKGLLALLLTLPLILAVYLTGSWKGWNWMNLLLYGPTGALSQVLFFRCALLPVTLRVLKGHTFLAVLLAALLHGLWHIGPVVQGAAWYGALPVMLVPFLGSIAWNWQVQHDRTVVWVSILHIFTDQGLVLFW